jgi:hypothetical protein
MGCTLVAWRGVSNTKKEFFVAADDALFLFIIELRLLLLLPSYTKFSPNPAPIMLSSPSSSHTSLLWNTSKTIPNPHAKVRPLTTKPSARRRDYQQAGVEVTSIIHSPSYHFTTALAHAPKVVAVGIANLTPSGINSKPTRSSS